MTPIPPSRYKVVERGRRLVVIDTLTGEPATHAPPVLQPARLNLSALPTGNSAPRRVDDRSGNKVMTTARFYDLKGPRELVLSEARARRIGRSFTWAIAAGVAFVMLALIFPLLWFLPVFLAFQPKARGALRGLMTRQLDTIDQIAG